MTKRKTARKPKTGAHASPRPLNARQERFAQEYIIDLNATQAAIRSGYSVRTAHAIGDENLRKPGIAAMISAAQAARSERTGITQDRVLKELAKVAFSDLADVADWGEKEVAIGYDEDGKRLAAEDIGDAVNIQYFMAPYLNLKNAADLSPEARAAVSEVALTKDGFKIKLHDKPGALEKIARLQGWIKDKPDLPPPGPTTVNIQINTMDPQEAANQYKLIIEGKRA